jgi:Mrp family chromosome partitioning ATPase
VRRPIDIERILGVPLFLSIPDMHTRSFRRKVKDAAKAEAQRNPEHSDLPALADSDPLHPFHETLRDRMIGYFESRNLTHKPKLVAVTGFTNSAGVTTTAAGLAKSLSETGEGNVLLVDLTLGQGSAQQFYKGRAIIGLEDILTTRGSAQVQDKLFVVAQEPGGDRISRILPQRFSKLVPKLKASDFDYIIFDMPPVSQISVTPRLAGFMDMVLLVVESEATDRDLVRRAAGLLAASKAHVGVVLNKTNSYVPAALHQEYLGNA